MAKVATGLILYLWDHTAGTPAYVAIGEIKNINGIGVTKDIIDVTHQGSSNSFRDKIAGLIETKPFSVDILLDWDIANSSQTNNHDVLNTLAESRTASKARIAFSSGGPNVVYDPAHVSELTFDAPLGGEVTATFTVTPSGKGTWASTYTP